jgi:type I restriction enzyme, S subunit
MAGEWREYTFADLIKSSALEIGDGYRAKNSELGGDGPIFLRAGHVRDTHIDLDGVDRFRRELAGAVASKMSRPGDVLVTTKGNSTGRTSYVGDNLPPVVYSPHLSYWRSLDDQVIDAGFLRYWSRSQHFQDQLDALAASTDMAPYLSLADQKRLRITLPPPGEQRAIGRILGSLDDKIELNRRTNETLEAIARALFKSWFVDFDPVRAKSEGRDPGLPTHLADLFPDSFEDSEVGEIPKGWRVSSVGLELATLLGGTPSRTEPTYWEGGAIPWINSGKANEFRITEPSEFITTEGMARSATKLLPERTTIVAITGATLGQVSLLEIEACANQSVVGVLGSRTLPGEFVYFWIRERIEDLVSRQTGGAQQHVNKNDVDGLAILMPSRQVVSAFQGIAGPIFDRIKISCLETRTLAALRDALLPKLISGELRVKHPEWLLEAAT